MKNVGSWAWKHLFAHNRSWEQYKSHVGFHITLQFDVANYSSATLYHFPSFSNMISLVLCNMISKRSAIQSNMNLSSVGGCKKYDLHRSLLSFRTSLAQVERELSAVLWVILWSNVCQCVISLCIANVRSLQSSTKRFISFGRTISTSI